MYEYEALKIRLQPGEEETYKVLASGPFGEVSGNFQLPFQGPELENFILRIGRPRRGVRSLGSPEMKAAQTLGSELFKALFRDNLRDLYHTTSAEADAAGKGLRITLLLGQTPELMNVPWEYMCDDGRFLSVSERTPIVRYLDLQKAHKPLPVEGPLKIVGMISSPIDVVELDVNAEKQRLQDALKSPIDRGEIELVWLENGTLTALHDALERDDFHIFHYLGHGGFDEPTGDGVLVLEDDRGRRRDVTGSYLGQLMSDERTLQLAVLNACEGGRAGPEDPFAGVATSLVKCEIPSVIAMQFEITDEAAILFAGGFYTALARGSPVDAALAAARKAIWANYNDIEWGTPVLFMRVPDGRVFDVAVHPAEDDDTSKLDTEALGVGLTAKPTVVDRGGEVVWTLSIENSGAATLSEVSALGADGAVVLEPCELGPGQSVRCNWRTRPRTDVEMGVTVNAIDPAGNLLTEQATGRVMVRTDGAAVGPAWPEPPKRVLPGGPERRPRRQWPRLQARYAIGLGALLVVVVVAVVAVVGTGKDGGSSGSAESYAAAISADRPGLFWQLGETAGSTATDRSGNGRQGSYHEVALGQDGILDDDAAAGFDRSSSVLQSGTELALANSSFTIELWARHTGHGEQQHLFSQGSARSNAGLHLAFRADDRFVCGFYNDDLNTSSVYADEEWHHWVCTYAAATLTRTLYRDGMAVASGNSSAAYQGTGQIAVGRTVWPARIANGFVGTIDEVAVYPSALTAERVRAHYDARG